MAYNNVDSAADALNSAKRFLLVVDSDAQNLRYLSGLLKRFGYQTCAAKSAQEAVEMALVATPALMITALDLKGVDGLTLMQDLRKNPGLGAVPFIGLRRQGDLAGEKRCRELGASDCLYQPVAPEKLYVSVQTATEVRPRKCIRLKTTLPVKVTNHLPENFENASTLDISEAGMFLRCAEPVEANSRLQLNFNLQGDTIPAEAKVIYSYRTPGGPYLQPGMGLEFTKIAPGARELIRRFVRSEITRDIAPVNA
jgi:CheY-like chemotaxis protein